MKKYTKFILPIALNIIILVVLPLVFNTLDEESLKNAWTAMLTFGNSIYFFIQGQMFGTKHKEGSTVVCINIICIVLYMYGFFGKLVPLYIAFYTAMNLLGLRAGGNQRKLTEYKNQKD